MMKSTASIFSKSNPQLFFSSGHTSAEEELENVYHLLGRFCIIRLNYCFTVGYPQLKTQRLWHPIAGREDT